MAPNRHRAGRAGRSHSSRSNASTSSQGSQVRDARGRFIRRGCGATNVNPHSALNTNPAAAPTAQPMVPPPLPVPQVVIPVIPGGVQHIAHSSENPPFPLPLPLMLPTAPQRFNDLPLLTHWPSYINAILIQSRGRQEDIVMPARVEQAFNHSQSAYEPPAILGDCCHAAGAAVGSGKELITACAIKATIKVPGYSSFTTAIVQEL
ncbi:hypothetical protein FQN51_007018 [Onygenales sp. PD_10]|nr:hypothetical protein FQN51_007018 [Onygenales sp. PD_10]